MCFQTVHLVNSPLSLVLLKFRNKMFSRKVATKSPGMFQMSSVIHTVNKVSAISQRVLFYRVLFHRVLFQRVKHTRYYGDHLDIVFFVGSTVSLFLLEALGLLLFFN